MNKYSLKWPKHDLFIDLWKDRNDWTGIVQSPLISFVQDLKLANPKLPGFNWEFKVDDLQSERYKRAYETT